MHMDRELRGPIPSKIIEFTSERRRALEHALNALIALFDALEGDTDLENEELENDLDFEPSLGALEEGSQLCWGNEEGEQQYRHDVVSKRSEEAPT